MAKNRRPKCNKGWFCRGHDARRHTGFTTEACRKGYQVAMERAMQHSWERYAWLYRRIRGYFRARKREEHGETAKQRAAGRRPWTGTGRGPNGEQPSF